MADKEKAWFVDSGLRDVPFDVIKGVRFVRGVGVLDHAGLMNYRPDIYEGGEPEGKYPRPNKQYATLDLEAFATYFDSNGCKVTEIGEAEAAKLRAAMAEGKAAPDKYLQRGLPWAAVPKAAVKAAADNVALPEADGGAEAPPIDEADLADAGAPVAKGKGGNGGGK